MQQTKSRVMSLVTPLLIYSISFAYEYILELIDLQRVRRGGQVNSDRWPDQQHRIVIITIIIIIIIIEFLTSQL